MSYSSVTSAIQSQNWDEFKKKFKPSHLTEKRGNLAPLLYTSCGYLDERFCKYLLEQGADPNEKYQDSTPIYYAAWKGHQSVLELLLESDRFQVTERDIVYPPIIIAAQEKHEHIVRVLMNHPKMDPNQYNVNGSTALTIAVEKGLDNIVKALLECPRIDPIKPYQDSCPLYLAAWKNHDVIAKMLLECPETDVNKTNNNGTSPLFIAAQEGNHEVVEVLVKSFHLDVNKTNANGSSPLSMASEKGHDKVIAELIKHPKLNPNAGWKDSAPIYLAAWKGHWKIVMLLLSHPKTIPDKLTDTGAAAIFIASQENKPSVVRELLKSPLVNPNRRNNTGSTAISIAAGNGHHMVVKELLASPRTDPNAGWTNHSPLYLAASNSHEQVVIELLKSPRIDIHLKNDLGIDPLKAASKKNIKDLIKKFIEKRKKTKEEEEPEEKASFVPSGSVGSWTVDQVAIWIDSLDLSQPYSSLVKKNHINGAALTTMKTKADWQELGVSVFGDLRALPVELEKILN